MPLKEQSIMISAGLADSTQNIIFTVGHSTHPLEEFISMLNAFSIKTLVDIRTIPKSRHNPQFNKDSLSKSLSQQNIDYIWMKDLGGLRHPRKDSPNNGWRNSSFRGYADYMQTEEFHSALLKLIELGKTKSAVIMCAETVPWRCHRSLVADALSIRHIPVQHIISTAKFSPHKLTEFAFVEGERITYPASLNHDLFSVEQNSLR